MECAGDLANIFYGQVIDAHSKADVCALIQFLGNRADTLAIIYIPVANIRRPRKAA